jgi:hypothetical protein
MAAWVSKQIGLLRSARVTETATQSQETPVGLATRSRKQQVPVGLLTQKAGLWKIRLTRKVGVWRNRLTWKAGLRRSRLTRKVGLWKIRLSQKTGLCKTEEVGNWKKERVLLQAKGQLHGGAPRSIAKTQKCILQKMRQRELAETKRRRRARLLV